MLSIACKQAPAEGPEGEPAESEVDRWKAVGVVHSRNDFKRCCLQLKTNNDVHEQRLQNVLSCERISNRNRKFVARHEEKLIIPRFSQFSIWRQFRAV